MNVIHLILVDPNPYVCDALDTYFRELPNVQVVRGQFESLAEFDCMVSPANSFGMMDGGIDAAIIRFFGNDLIDKVHQHILKEFLGEQPVGTSFIVATGHVKHPYLAHTPTMRVPANIADTENVYVAMAAMLRAVYHHNRVGQQPISVIACPGLGTGTGQVNYGEAARQMALAYKYFLNPPARLDWHLADLRHSEIGKRDD